MAGKNFIYFAAVGAISSFVLFGKKKKPKAKCTHVRTAGDFAQVMGAKSGIRFPAAIVYYPDNVSPEKAEAFCGLTIKANWTVVLMRTSDYNRWSGENVEPGIVVMASSGKGVFKKWSELASGGL